MSNQIHSSLLLSAAACLLLFAFAGGPCLLLFAFAGGPFDSSFPSRRFSAGGKDVFL